VPQREKSSGVGLQGLASAQPTDSLVPVAGTPGAPGAIRSAASGNSAADATRTSPSGNPTSTDKTTADFFNENDKLVAAVVGLFGTAGVLAGLSKNTLISALLSVWFYVIGVVALRALFKRTPTPGRSGLDLLLTRAFLQLAWWTLAVLGFPLYIVLYRTELAPLLAGIIPAVGGYYYLRYQVKRQSSRGKEVKAVPSLLLILLPWLIIWLILAHILGSQLVNIADWVANLVTPPGK